MSQAADDGGGGARQARVASAESEDALVHAAVERFVELHSCGDAPELDEFVQIYPEALRARIVAQCTEFLAFDGLLGHQPWESPAEEPGDANRVFGDFEITEELGRGGMGVVYLARQRSLNRRVALKVMASGLTLSSRHVERFRREAAATAQLRHPAIVPVHSLEEVDGTFAIAMDFIAGRNLADILDDLRLRNGDQPSSIEGTLGLAPEKGYVAECAMFCAQVASALSAAHAQGVMHRDLKPRNLMIDDRRQARLLDFGLSKSLGDGSLSMSGEITGTVHYMSPEQTLAKRVAVDHRTDVFALGVILYELLTLQRPFVGRNMQQIVYEICFKEPVSPHRLNPKVPRDLVTICQKALEKDPNNRYASAAELEADLQRFLSWEPIHAKPTGALSRLVKWTKRHRTETLAAAAVLAVAATGIGYAWYGAAADEAEAGRLLQEAERHHDAGDFQAAFDSATQALGKRDDQAIKDKIKVYRLLIEGEAKQAEVNAADSARLALESKNQIAFDRRLALLLALEAVDRLPSSDSRSAVLDALGSGFRTTRLAGHAGYTVCARWSSDGRTVVTAGTDANGADHASAILWNVDGSERARLVGHQHWIVDAAFHPGGKLVATASIDGTVRLWHTDDGTPAGIWPHGQRVQHVEFDADGGRALTHGYATDERGEQTIRARVFDVLTGECIATCDGHTRFVQAEALAPDGSVVATFGNADHVKLWAAQGETELARLPIAEGQRATAIAFTPDSAVVAVASSDGLVRLWSAQSGELLGSAAHGSEITSLCFDARGERLLTGSTDMSARLWRLNGSRRPGQLGLREEQLFVGHGKAVTSVDFDPTGRLVATGCADGVLRVFDAGNERSAAGVELMRYEVGGAVGNTARFSPDAEGGRILAIAGRQPILWNFTASRGLVTLRQPGKVPAARFDPSGDRVATAGDDERLRLWDAHDGSLLWVSPKLGNPTLALDIDPAGERVATSTVGTGKVFLHRLSDCYPIHTFATDPVSLPIVRFAAGGTRLLAAGKGGVAVIWNTNDFSEVCKLVRREEIVAADLSRDGTLLATVEAGESVARLWSLPGGQAKGEIGGTGAALTQVAFHPDGDAVLTAGATGIVCISDLAGATRHTIDAGSPVQHATWSRDGRLLLTSGKDDGSRVRLWNVDEGTEQLRFDGHSSAVESIAFGPDGRWAATTFTDGTTRIWPTDPVERARALGLPPLTAAERTTLDRKPD